MAMFREHIGWGAVVAVVFVVAVYAYALVTDVALLGLLFLTAVVGSFLPDVDSDSSMPFYLVYGAMTVSAGGVALLYVLPFTADWRYLVAVPIGVIAIMWFVIGAIIKKLTHHRGIFHSLPALAIAGLGALLLARMYGLTDAPALLLGGAMALGYLTHLVLDEFYDGITLDGLPFVRSDVLGGSLKMFARSNVVNVATYTLLITLLYHAI